MIFFTCLINIIESFLFTYFLSNYFELYKSKIYTFVFSFLQFCLLSYANYIENSGLWLTVSIVTLMIFSLFIWKRKIKFDYIYIVILYNAMLIISSYFAAFITNAFISLFPNMSSLFYYIACAIAKTLQTLFTFYAIKNQHHLSTSFDLKNWTSVIVSDGLVLIALAIVVYALLTANFTQSIMMLLLVVLFFLAVNLRVMIYKTDRLNKEKVEFVKTSELAKFNQQKFEMMNHIKNDIAATDHRMFYMLMQIEHYLNAKEYDKLSEAVEKYRDLMSKYKLVTNTNNVVFDCLYSLKINDLVLQDISVENSIFISENEIYNNISFINFLTGLFDYFTDCSLLHVSMNEIGELLSIKIVYRKGTIKDVELASYCERHINDCGSYNLSNHEIKGIRISINMKRKYE